MATITNIHHTIYDEYATDYLPYGTNVYSLVYNSINKHLSRIDCLLSKEQDVCLPLVFNKSSKKKDMDIISSILSHHENRTIVKRLKETKTDLLRYKDEMIGTCLSYREICQIFIWIVNCDAFLKREELRLSIR